MASTIATILLVIAFVLACAAAFGWSWRRGDLGWASIAFALASIIVSSGILRL